MTESEEMTDDNGVDDELREALAAFGEDALSMLDDDDDYESPMEPMISDSDDAPSSPQPEKGPRVTGTEIKDDDPPLIRYMKELNRAIYANAPVTLQNQNSLDTGDQASASRTPRYVVFAVDGQQFGVQLNAVLEIARYPKVTELPRTPSWLRGITNLRGQILSITDLRELLQSSGTRPAVGEKIIVIHSQKNAAATALAVDRVVGIRSIENKNDEISELRTPADSIADSVATVDHAATVLIDPDKLFETAELGVAAR